MDALTRASPSKFLLRRWPETEESHEGSGQTDTQVVVVEGVGATSTLRGLRGVISRMVRLRYSIPSSAVIFRKTFLQPETRHVYQKIQSGDGALE